MTDSRRHSTGKATDPARPAANLPPPRPFHPHRKLFLLIGAMLFAWLAVLLILYFTTVYPYRHSRVEYPGEHLRTSPAPAAP